MRAAQVGGLAVLAITLAVARLWGRPSHSIDQRRSNNRRGEGVMNPDKPTRFLRTGEPTDPLSSRANLLTINLYNVS